MTGTTASYLCKWCKNPFTARTADRKRGWAQFCSKSCKAMKQQARSGRGRGYQEWRERQETNPTFVGCAVSIDDHDCNKGEL